MTNPTRQEMLDSITHKIARTGGGTGPGETGYYLPVMAQDIVRVFPNIAGHLDEMWTTLEEPLDKQSDDCITYIFNLLPPSPITNKV